MNGRTQISISNDVKKELDKVKVKMEKEVGINGLTWNQVIMFLVNLYGQRVVEDALVSN